MTNAVVPSNQTFIISYSMYMRDKQTLKGFNNNNNNDDSSTYSYTQRYYSKIIIFMMFKYINKSS